MITWEDNYHGQPDGVLRELKQLEEIFAKYPETSFRPMILYQMAQRCHILYEIYSFLLPLRYKTLRRLRSTGKKLSIFISLPRVARTHQVCRESLEGYGCAAERRENIHV